MDSVEENQEVAPYTVDSHRLIVVGVLLLWMAEEGTLVVSEIAVVAASSSSVSVVDHRVTVEGSPLPNFVVLLFLL